MKIIKSYAIEGTFQWQHAQRRFRSLVLASRKSTGIEYVATYVSARCVVRLAVS